MIKMRYSELITLDPGDGLFAKMQYSASSLYDPNYTTTGHQPRGFDQWIVRYTHAYVVGAKISVVCVPTSTSDVVPVAYGITKTPTASEFAYYSSFADIVETSQNSRRGMHKYKIGGLLNDPNPKALTHYFSAKRDFGKNIVGNTEYANTASASPTEQSFFNVWAISPNTGDGGAVSLSVIIDYIAVFTELKKLEAS
jgi:hypothetical protein